MAITENYEPYDFNGDDNDPGCGVADHEPACLCDVDITKSPAYGKPNAPALAFGALATQALYERDVAPTLENWAGELLGLYEKANELGVRLKVNAVELDEIRSRYWEKLGADNRTKIHDGQVCHAEVKELLAAGLTVGAAVRFLERPWREVVGQLVDPEDDGAEALSALADAIDQLLAGCESYQAVARATGVHYKRVERLAAMLGVESNTSANKVRGGGSKYTPAQYAEIRRLRGRNKSYGEIAEATGIPRAAVAKFCQRHVRAVVTEGQVIGSL